MRKTYLWEDGDSIYVRHVYNADDIYAQNAIERQSNKGFTRGHKGFGGNLRKVASIPMDDLERLAREGNQDAVCAIAGSGEDATQALRRLIRQHPEWRSSEGAI
jgi:hypothetical protein